MPHRFHDHTADIAVEVTASSLPGLFAAAARAFTDTVTPVEGVAERQGRTVEVEVPAEALPASPRARRDLLRRELLVAWLEELLFLFETEGLLSARAEVDLAPGALRGRIIGERYDPDRHPVKVLVKAVTYHALEVEPVADGWRARVIFDI